LNISKGREGRGEHGRRRERRWRYGRREGEEGS